MFPEPPPAPQPVQLAAQGAWGGPTYSYRGARIECGKGEHLCALFLEGHPLDRLSFGVAGTIIPLVDLWLDEGRPPDYMRAVPKAGR